MLLSIPYFIIRVPKILISINRCASVRILGRSRWHLKQMVYLYRCGQGLGLMMGRRRSNPMSLNTMLRIFNDWPAMARGTDCDQDLVRAEAFEKRSVDRTYNFRQRAVHWTLLLPSNILLVQLHPLPHWLRPSGSLS